MERRLHCHKSLAYSWSESVQTMGRLPRRVKGGEGTKAFRILIATVFLLLFLSPCANGSPERVGSTFLNRPGELTLAKPVAPVWGRDG